MDPQHNPKNGQDFIIVALMLLPIVILIAPWIVPMQNPVLDEWETILLLGLPVIIGIAFHRWLVKKHKRKLARFCLVVGLVPIGWLCVVLLGVQMGLWY